MCGTSVALRTLGSVADGRALMIDDYGILQVAGIALIIALLVGRMGSKKASAFFKPRTSKVKKALPAAIFRKHQAALSATKKCPNCAGNLPISTLVCDACEYNFLSGTVGLRNKLLPSPDEPETHEAPKRSFAYRT